LKRLNILSTPAVNASDFGSAALAVHEVDCFPNAVAPGVISDAERTSLRVSGFDQVRARLAHFREIQYLIFAQRGGSLRDRFGQNNLAGLRVNYRELTRCQIAGDCRLRGTYRVVSVDAGNFYGINGTS